MARNALLGFALLAALAGCSSAGDEADAQAAEAQLAALRARNDSLRAAPAATASASATATVADTGASSTLAATTPAADSAAADTVSLTEAAVADSIQKAREIEVMRETFAYSGGSRDPFDSLLNSSSTGPEIGRPRPGRGLPEPSRQPTTASSVLREKATGKRYKLRVGDQLGRARLVQIRPRDAVFTIRGLRVRTPGNSLAAQAGGRDAMTGLYRMIVNATVHLARSRARRRAARDLVIGGAAPARAEGPGTGEVTAVSLAPAAGKAELVIAVQRRGGRARLPARPPRPAGARCRGRQAERRRPSGVRRGGARRRTQPPLLPVPARHRPDRRSSSTAPRTYEVERQGDVHPGLASAPTRRSWPGRRPRRMPSWSPSRRGAGRRRPRSVRPWPAPPCVGRAQRQEPRITVTWDRASIADVVAGFAAFSGRTIILGKDVKGEVTAEVEEPALAAGVPGDPGERRASRPRRCRAASSGSTRPGVLAALDSLEPLETSVVRINYAQRRLAGARRSRAS